MWSVVIAAVLLLTGGHFFPVTRDPVAKVNASETDLRTLVEDISQIMGSRIDVEMRDFESRFKRDLDVKINTVPHFWRGQSLKIHHFLYYLNRLLTAVWQS